MLDKLNFRMRDTGTDLGLLVPLLLNSFIVQTAISIVRITTSYRAVELGLSVVTLGLITAAFALLPIFIAVQVGRFIDRGHDALSGWIGNAFIVAACAIFVVWPTPAALFVGTAVLGIGHMFLMIAQQMLCIRAAGPRRMEHVFGNYMVANAIGHGVGPWIVGWLGGAAAIPPTHTLFIVGLCGASLAMVFVLVMRPGREAQKPAGNDDIVPVRRLLGIAGLPAVLLVSVVTVTSQDLVVVYLPFMGTERGIDVRDVGILLAARAIAAMVSRLIYPPLVTRVGRRPLMVISTLAGALSFIALAIPMPLPLMHVVVIAMGFALGISMTLAVTGVVDLALPGTRGTANSLRLMGNRVGQFAIPIGVGVVAAGAGVSAIFLILAVGLGASAAAVHFTWPKR